MDDIKPWEFFGFTESEYKNKISTYFEEKIRQSIRRGEMQAYQAIAFEQKYDEEKKIMKQKSKKNPDEPYAIWLTVNPQKDVKFSDFQKKIEKLHSKPWIKSYIYVFEATQTDNKNDGVHFHAHTLIVPNEEYKYQSKRIRTELSSTVKSVCNTSIENCFKLVFLTDKELIKQKIKYMMGDKQESKTEALEFTRQFRDENKLNNYYSSSASLFLLAEEGNC